ncbi:MAG: AAA family ATPase [Planctomycetota bacterium]
MIERIAIAGYRSLRSIVLRLEALTVVSGPNGSGKSNIYRALQLLAKTADGELVSSLAAEGGLESVLWAGPETITNEMKAGQIPVQGTLRRKPISLKLGMVAEPFSYCVDLGLPVPSGSMFDRDPELKRECLWAGQGMEARQLCADRRGNGLRCRSGKGKWQEVEMNFSRQSSMLAEYADPFAAPELIVMRDVLRSWRFYDSFRTDRFAPARGLSVGTLTPIMSGDGHDLAAALQTIREIGDASALAAAVDDAFPGSTIAIHPVEGGLQLHLHQPGMLRPLTAAELSDGTLRFLLLVAALLTPREPALMILNEPENSLHPDLLPALARLIISASERTQVVVVTHSQQLREDLEVEGLAASIRLHKDLGETLIEDGNALDQLGWKWPAR